MLKTNIITPIRSHMGYAQMARLIWPALKSVTEVGCREIDVQSSAVDHGAVATDMLQFPAIKNPDITVINMIPPIWDRARAAGRNIGYSTFEADRLPRSWVSIANKYDACWTTSAWNEQVMLSSGVNAPVHVIPPIAVGNILEKPGSKSGKFRFLASFQWGERKNPTALIRAFCAAFDGNPDVQLIIKSHVMANEAQSKATIEAGVKQVLDSVRVSAKPDIKILCSIQSSHDMSKLTAACHAGISLSHGEGWGLPLWESALAGRPVITTGWSAPAEWLGNDYPFLVKHNMSPVYGGDGNMRSFFEPGMLWAEPQLDSAIDIMRHVYKNYDYACQVATTTAGSLFKKYDLQSCQAAIKSSL